MNKKLKICLLAAAVVLVIGGVLICLKAIASPPIDLEIENQYVNELNRQIQAFKEVGQEDTEKDFASLTDFTHRLKIESVIDNKDFDGAYVAIVDIYAPKFSKYCFDQFLKPVWNDNEHKWMEGRIAQLRKLTVNDGAEKIMDRFVETDEEFSTIVSTIQKNRDARALARHATFLSWSDAHSKIKQASQYRADPYLKNNVDLMKSLSNLSSKLESSLYASLQSQTHRLANYQNYSQDGYNRLKTDIKNSLNEYKEKAHEFFGLPAAEVKRKYDSLSDIAYNYSIAADKYYNEEERKL